MTYFEYLILKKDSIEDLVCSVPLY